MRIGVNLLPLKPRQIGGLESCTKKLLERMIEIDENNQYLLFIGEWNEHTISFPKGRYRKLMVASEEEQQDLYMEIKRQDIDLLFCPLIYLEPRNLRIPTVIMIPDIQHEYWPQFFTRAELKARALIYKPSCEEATEVITLSNFSRASLIERYGPIPEKIHCVYPAPVWQFRSPQESSRLEDVRRQYGVEEDYILYPANMWAHKNHEMLLLGLYQLGKRHGLRPKLVLLGQDMGRSARIKELIEHLALTGQVHFLRYVDDQDVANLMQGARCLVFPSLYEGFGLPLVEAMAAGCPIACARVASIPEVVGDAGLFFDPRNPDEIAEAIMSVWSDDTLRQGLTEKGRARVKQFSWDKAARETLGIFEIARVKYRGWVRSALA